jgi:pyruvate/2-oxoglutarate dehydrogenase complex dihydrolipoamide dehydrogenase (E3) component
MTDPADTAREERTARDRLAVQGEGPYRALPRSAYDLIVVGGGSAGLSAAGLAAALGARVALLDRERLGGECLYTGCVPSKALLHVAGVAAHIRAAGALGLDAGLSPVDLGAVADSIQRAIQTIHDQTDNPAHYQRLGVDVGFGHVRFLSGDRLALNGRPVRAKRFLIATGSHPTVPDIPGLEDGDYQTNETIFALRTLPVRLAVIGGGPVGSELGQAFARLGSQVTILQRAERLLPRDEPEAAELLRARLEAEGVTVVTRASVTGIARSDGSKVVAFSTPHAPDTGGQPQEVAVDELLVAVGRSPNVAGLDLEAAGVRYDPRTGISVDRRLRTTNPRIYAAGDVIGDYRFTHAAALHARTAVRNALFPGGAALDERVMPWATFTEPEVAHVGLTEEQARRQHGDAVLVFTQRLRDVDRAVTDGGTEGFVKLVSAKDGTLLGAQIVGHAAGEYINELALALQGKLSLSDLAATTHVYPTFALAIQQAAGRYTVAKLRRNRLVRLLRALSR